MNELSNLLKKFESLESFITCPKLQAIKELGISEIQYDSLLLKACKKVYPLEVDDQQIEKKKINFRNSKLDEIASGSGLNEITGESGTGKSQLCLQLTVTECLKGKFVVYVATESSFPFSRFYQMLPSQETIIDQLKDNDNLSEDLEELGKLVLVHHIGDLDTLETFINFHLKNLLISYDIGLVIIDSITCLFRIEQGPKPELTLVQFSLASKMKELSFEFNVPFVCVNQVSANFQQNDDIGLEDCEKLLNYHSMPFYKELADDPALNQFVPAMGLSWSNCIDNRIMLTRNERNGIVERRLYFLQGENDFNHARFKIIEKGIFSF